MKTLYLVRHGENHANITREFSHRAVDYSLTEKGVEPARQTAAYLATRRIDAVFASPLKRARETAAPIAAAFGVPVVTDEGFRELNVGTLETEGELEANWRIHHAILDRWRLCEADAAFPAGEDYHQLTARFRAAVERVLAATASTAVIVGHGGNLRFGVPAVAHWEVPEPGELSPNCSISTLQFAAGIPGRVVAWADVTHLSGRAAQFVAGVIPRQSL